MGERCNAKLSEEQLEKNKLSLIKQSADLKDLVSFNCDTLYGSVTRHELSECASDIRLNLKKKEILAELSGKKFTVVEGRNIIFPTDLKDIKIRLIAKKNGEDPQEYELIFTDSSSENYNNYIGNDRKILLHYPSKKITTKKKQIDIIKIDEEETIKIVKEKLYMQSITFDGDTILLDRKKGFSLSGGVNSYKKHEIHYYTKNNGTLVFDERGNLNKKETARLYISTKKRNKINLDPRKIRANNVIEQGLLGKISGFPQKPERGTFWAIYNSDMNKIVVKIGNETQFFDPQSGQRIKLEPCDLKDITIEPEKITDKKPKEIYDNLPQMLLAFPAALDRSKLSADNEDYDSLGKIMKSARDLIQFGEWEEFSEKFRIAGIARLCKEDEQERFLILEIKEGSGFEGAMINVQFLMEMEAFSFDQIPNRLKPFGQKNTELGPLGIKGTGDFE